MSNKVAKAGLPAQIIRVEDAPLQPHEVVGDYSKAEYDSKENIPEATRYPGLFTTEVQSDGSQKHYRLVGGIANSNWVEMADQDKFDTYKPNAVTHSAYGELMIDLGQYQFNAVSLEEGVSQLKIQGGQIGHAYRFTLSQDGAYSYGLTLAPSYPAAGISVNEGDVFLYQKLSSSGFIESTRVYKATQGYQSQTIEGDITGGNLVPYIYLPDGVVPLLSQKIGLVDSFLVTVIGTDQYVLSLEYSNM